jgi:hypothetical protein
LKTPLRNGAKSGPQSAHKVRATYRQLPPKLQFGLRLLARATDQRRADLIEQAVTAALDDHRSHGQTILEIVEQAWVAEDEDARLAIVLEHAPTLVPYDDYLRLTGKSGRADGHGPLH